MMTVTAIYLEFILDFNYDIHFNSTLKVLNIIANNIK